MILLIIFSQASTKAISQKIIAANNITSVAENNIRNSKLNTLVKKIKTPASDNIKN